MKQNIPSIHKNKTTVNPQYVIQKKTKNRNIKLAKFHAEALGFRQKCQKTFSEIVNGFYYPSWCG